MQQNITWTIFGQVLWCHMASLGHNNLSRYSIIVVQISSTLDTLYTNLENYAVILIKLSPIDELSQVILLGFVFYLIPLHSVCDMKSCLISLESLLWAMYKDHNAALGERLACTHWLSISLHVGLLLSVTALSWNHSFPHWGLSTQISWGFF